MEQVKDEKMKKYQKKVQQWTHGKYNHAWWKLHLVIKTIIMNDIFMAILSSNKGSKDLPEFKKYKEIETHYAKKPT